MTSREPDVDILFIQPHRAVLKKQASGIRESITEVFPNARVTFVSEFDEVPLQRYAVVVTPTVAWLPEVVERTRPEWVHFLSSGVDRVPDLQHLSSKVKLSSSKGVHANAIAEYVLGAILYFEKDFRRFDRQKSGALWERTWLREISSQRMTILGMGAVGSRVAEMASAFGVEVEGFRRRDGVAKLRESANGADYLVVCLPLTASTRGLVSEELLFALAQESLLVDVSRGGVVDEAAVVRALEVGPLRGAALDVFEEEPLGAGSELWGMSNILLTPHVSGTTQRYMERAVDVFVSNLKAFLCGETLPTAVDPGLGY